MTTLDATCLCLSQREAHAEEAERPDYMAVFFAVERMADALHVPLEMRGAFQLNVVGLAVRLADKYREEGEVGA